MTKKIFLLAIIISSVLTSCVKNQCGYLDTNITASTSEITYMQSYFAANNIDSVIQDPSGVYYKINNTGTGSKPNLCSAMLVNYSAYRFGYGNAFDSYTDPNGISFVLGSLIVGVQKTMPKIKPGGSITMYIPPSLAYGNNDIRDGNGNVILPANSYIKFDMSLIAVQ
jgi:FKBP-type peptidyl-prolyl cis-trans isomerase